MPELIVRPIVDAALGNSAYLLAFPGAIIYSFDRTPAEVVPYAELEHVVLTREFLNAPERYLRALRDG